MNPPIPLSTAFAEAPPVPPLRIPDGQLANRVVAALGAFEAAINTANLAGFHLEPRFERVRDRLPGVEESFVATLSIVRRPSQSGLPRRTISSPMAVTETGGD